MAYIKKADRQNQQPNEKVVEKIIENTAVSDERDKKIADLESKIELLTRMLANNSSTPSTVKSNSLMDEVKIVHLVDRDPGLTTHIELTSTTIDMTAFGEERTLDRRQAEELVGKYRQFFLRGFIAFGQGSDDFAKKAGVPSVSDYSYLTSDFVQKLGTLSAFQLEELFTKLNDGHKEFIIGYFKRQIMKNNPLFKDPQKIEVLDRLSDGAMSGTALDIRTENIKK